MDTPRYQAKPLRGKAADIYWELRMLSRPTPRPIRIPTAQWLFSDLFGMLDSDVRAELTWLERNGWITVESGGWISCRLEQP